MSAKGGDIMDSLKSFGGFGGSMFQKSVSVGIDVGSRSVKIVELGRKKDKLFLKDFTIVKTKADLIKAGTSGVISGDATDVLNKIVKTTKLNDDKVNVSVPSFSSLITTIEIPKMPKREIEKVVQIEAPKYIPVDLDDVVYGWQIVDDGGDEDYDSGKPSTIRVMVVAIMKEISGQYENVFSEAGFEIESLEIDSFSLQRGLVGSVTGCHVILDVGHKVSNILIVCDGNILLNRTIDVAGERITKAVARGMNIDDERAEQYKIENGVGGAVGQDGGVISQMLNVLVSEIVQTIEVFKETYPKKEPESIILSGGGAYMKGLEKFIADESGIKAELGNPFFDVELPEAGKDNLLRYGPLLSVSIGLAKLSFEEKK
jgi:type IV pilus assembly protein PilM